MFIRFVAILFFFLLFCSSAFAEIKRVTVLEFRGVAIEEAMLLKLSDQARKAALDTLSKEEYLIMTRENMMQVLSDMGKDASCIEGSCEVELGRNIGADLIITGDILKIDASYVLTLKLYETKNGGLLQIKEVQQESLLVLKDDTYTQSVVLLKEGLEIGAKIAWKPQKNERKKKENLRISKNKQAKIYSWTGGGFFAASTVMYGGAFWTKSSFNNAESLENARDAYKQNIIFHSIATGLIATSSVFFILGQQKARKARKEEGK